MSSGPRIVVVATLVLTCVPMAQAQCLPITEGQKTKIIAYLSKWYGLPETEDLSILSDDLVPDSCYRRLVVKGRTVRPESFFLSPSQRYLSGSLLDLTSDPTRERSRAKDEINKVLLSEPSPGRGGLHAPITIVEFGDFECPFCKRLNDWVQALAAEGIDLRLVFKHFPVTGHPWARDAAAFAICAEKQSNDAFWRLHDFFFENQAALNGATLKERLMLYVKDDPRIDSSRLVSCVHKNEADERIARDSELAAQFRVRSTPTLFVNGERVGALQSTNDLRSVLQRALKSETGGNE